MAETGRVQLLVLTAGQDDVGPYMKVEVQLKDGTTTIRWGLDAYTFEHLTDSLSAPSKSRRSADYPAFFLGSEVLKDEEHNQYFGLITGFPEQKTTAIRHFLCSELFASNVQWLSQVSGLQELAGIAWREDASRRVGLHWLANRRSFVLSVTALAVVLCGASYGIAYPYTVAKAHASSRSAVDSSNTRAAVDSLAGNGASNRSTAYVTSSGPVNQTTRSAPSVAAAETLGQLGSRQDGSLHDTSGSYFLDRVPLPPIGDPIYTVINQVPEIYGVPKGEVALTFDDGPSPYTEKILAILQQFHVRATFFFVGQRVQDWPAAVKEAVQQGEAIGDHSLSHPLLTVLSSAGQLNQIVDGATKIEALDPVRISLFRPPYGAFDQTTESILAKQHMDLTLWNRDPRDWAAKTPQQVVDAVLNDDPSGGIFDMHETEFTVEALPTILQGLEKKGIQVVALGSPVGQDG